jgi:hemolysin activation/secretion protein
MLNMTLCLVILLAVMMPLPLHAAEEEVPRFAVARYQVEGNTLLPPEEVDALLAGFTGKDKDFGDVQQALEALEAAYRGRGYNAVAVVLPEQELDQGTVRLRVVEGRVRNITVEGNAFHSRENILNAFPSLKTGTTPLVHGLSKELFVSNENPSKKVALQMQSGENEDDLTASLKVTDQRPWTAGIMGDNTGTGQTGDYRMSLLLQHNNLFDLDHSLTLVYNTSPDHMDKVNIVSAAYRIPLYQLGDSLELSAGYSDVNSGSVAFDGFNLLVSGKGVVAGIRYNHNLQRFGDYQHKLSLGFDYKDFDNSLTLLGMQLGNNIVVHPLSLTYAGILGLTSGELDFYLSGSHNEPWGAKGQQEDFEKVNASASADYSIFRFGTNLGYALPDDWQARAVFTGQYTGDVLVPGEQFGLGGATSVRGFSEREVAGDCGFAGSLEVYSPNLAPLLKLKPADIQARLLGFYDAGTAFPVSDAPAGTPDYTISSIGTGLRLGWSTHFSFAFDWGYVLQGSETTRSGDSAVHFRTVFIY